MAIDFPASPTNGQLFTASNGGTYQWNGTFWLPVGNSSVLTASDTPPTTPSSGQLWFNSVLGQLFVWYNDGSSQQWVPANPVPMVAAGGDFSAYNSAGMAIPTTTLTTLVLNTVRSGNSGGWYSTSTGKYVPPVGRYFIAASVTALNGAGTFALQAQLTKNGVSIGNSNQHQTVNLWATCTLEVTVDANGTDYFELQAASSLGGANSTSANTVLFTAFPISGIKGPPGDPGAQGAPGAAGTPGPGMSMQTVSTQSGAMATGTTTIPATDAIPTTSTGTEFMTCSITPKSATSTLYIEVTFNGAHSVVAVLCAALFQDSTANALAAAHAPTIANGTANIRFTHRMISGTTSPTTFSVRAGGSAAGTTTFNGASAARRYGGVMASSIVITEVAP
jgi:hypothetical protein